MHKFLRTMTAAAVAAAMAPAFAVDATYNVDVVVVGAGAAGTAAGWAAAEKGLKVVTLEKQAMVGGTGKFSEGIFAVESSMQRNWNYGLTKDEAFQKIMNYGHWRGNAKMVRAFVDKSGETIDWMQANGVKFEKLFSNYPNGLYTWHIYEGRGAGWINLFQQKYKDAGQTLLRRSGHLPPVRPSDAVRQRLSAGRHRGRPEDGCPPRRQGKVHRLPPLRKGLPVGHDDLRRRGEEGQQVLPLRRGAQVRQALSGRRHPLRALDGPHG